MHAVAGEVRNMKHRGIPLITLLTQPTYDLPINLPRIQRRASTWLWELLEDPQPMIDVRVSVSKDVKAIETHITYEILKRINRKLAERGSGVWRFTGFDVNGDPNYHWRDV